MMQRIYVIAPLGILSGMLFGTVGAGAWVLLGVFIAMSYGSGNPPIPDASESTLIWFLEYPSVYLTAPLTDGGIALNGFFWCGAAGAVLGCLFGSIISKDLAGKSEK